MHATSRNAVLYAFIVAIGGFVFGFDASVIGGVVGYVTRQFALEPWQIGLVVSAPTLAAVFASLTVGIVSDLIGRKRILLLLALLYFVSAFLSASAWSFTSLVIARAIGGYAFGSLTQAPIYIAEIAPANVRGRMVAIQQLTIVVGLSTADFTNYAIEQLTSGAPGASPLPGEPWRWMLGLEVVPAAVWVLALLGAPESPRWLATKGRWEEARATLARIAKPAAIEATLADIAAQIDAAAAQSRARFADLLSRRIRFALVIGLIVAIVQQITGINTVFFYAPTIFEQSGVGEDAAFAQAVLVGLTNVAGTLVAMALVDRVGRRPLMIAGLAGVMASLALVAYGFRAADYVLDEADIASLAAIAPPEALTPLAGEVFESDVRYKKALSAAVGADVLRDHEAAFLKAGMRGEARIILVG
ncbi:MAG: sugar porter family MFS transporter, partial [Caulobacterales bacterium]|nr:sugar porter family MFS transporter [Caulobacterales bacterium]